MAKSYFTILEVTSNASCDEIRSAYRRLAKAYHPDYYVGGNEPFQKIQEAYSVLGDPARRKAYENAITNIRIKKPMYKTLRSEPEPLVPEQGTVDLGKISPVRFFETFSPSYDEIFDWLWDNFLNIEMPKSGRIQNLTMEVPLTKEQALRG
ncbi:MAG: DnaJ domain-containing protein [Desulfobacterales bacterium]|nr:DnaJ domain-containing protein [Desulfobacterales bacterium]